MKARLMLAVSATLLTALVGLVLVQQTPGQKAEQNGRDSGQKAIKVRTGEVKTVDLTTNQVVIKDEAAVETRILITSSTKIAREGKSITLADVKAGEKLSIECAESSDGCNATSIQVVRPSPSQ